MNLVTLIVQGEESALKALVKEFPLTYDSQWSKGDLRRNGKVCRSSGFVTTIANAENSRELVIYIRDFLEKCKKQKIIFSQFTLCAQLSVGLTVGDSKQFIAGVEFSSVDLQLLSECGITLSITAYPTSDEANK
jgi:hypothetical protein